MSFYTSLTGLKNAQTDLGVISNNIANAETNGFKSSRVDFADIVATTAQTSPTMTVGIGAQVSAIKQSFKAGATDLTGNALDVAITGEGFFTTRDAVSGNTYYTRNGSFDLDSSGYIHDDTNNRLQIYAPGGSTLTDAQIPLTNGAGSEYAGITIAENGDVTASYADGSNTVIGTVALASFSTPTGLRQEGSSNWSATGLSGAASYGTPSTGKYGGLLSGAVERSNVDIAEELVGLITAQRNFQANAKAIDTATQISQTVINLRS